MPVSVFTVNQEAKLLERDSLLLHRQREMSQLETELNVAKTSTFKW